MFYVNRRTEISLKFIAVILLFFIIVTYGATIVIAFSDNAIDDTETITTLAPDGTPPEEVPTTSVLTTSMSMTSTPEISSTKVKVLNDIPITYPKLTYKICYDTSFYETLMKKAQIGLVKISKAIKSGDYTSDACEAMSAEVSRLKVVKNRAKAAYDRISSWEDEYYYATNVWMYFQSRGYNEAITSAIIGNMMVETSGGSLALKPTIYDDAGEYYGLCQWSLYYKPEVDGMSFTSQLEYLEEDMAWELNTFGKLYTEGFTYEDFLAMEDPEEAAYAFAVSYERCASFSYYKREAAARVAYDYFNLEDI